MKGKRNNNPRGELERNLAAFFEAYETEGNCAAACRKIGLDPSAYKNWIKRVPDYQERFDAAHQKWQATQPQRSEATLVDRAFNGIKEVVRDRNGKAVFDRVDSEGNIVGDDYTGPTTNRLAERTVYFPNDLIALNKAWNPERYGDKQKVFNDGKVTVEVVYRTPAPGDDADDPHPS